MKRWAMAMGLLLGALASVAHGWAQAVSPVPKLELDRYVGTWYEIAKLPNKREKRCQGDALVLLTVRERPLRSQIVKSCRIKGDNFDSSNAKASMNKAGDGRVNVSYVWPFSEKDWVLAVAPDYSWVLVGSPNHKLLWVLSRAAKMEPSVLSEIEAKAATQGFAIAKLVTVPQRGR